MSRVNKLLLKKLLLIKHSSRMHTIRCSGRRGGGVSALVHAGIPARGCLLQCMLGYTPPLVDRIFDSITFPQLLLQTVTIETHFHSQS